nr:type II secretion system F family protein [Streptomyces sp. XM4193]
MTARLTGTRGLAPAAAGTGAGISVAVLLDGLLGTPLGLLLGACSAAAAWRAVGKRPGRGRGEKAELREAGRQLPFAAELLAACLAAGSRPREAAWAVGASLGGPLGERLVRVCQELRLGAEPDAAWRCVAEVEGGRRLARCLEQAEQSGAPVVDEISRQAATARADRARAGAARARQAAVHVTAPLGLCFLPAFLLATVVPVVIGLGQRLS